MRRAAFIIVGTEPPLFFITKSKCVPATCFNVTLLSRGVSPPLGSLGVSPVQRPCWEIHIIKRLSEISGENRMAAVCGGLLRRQLSIWTSFKSSLINVFMLFFPSLLLSYRHSEVCSVKSGASVQHTAPTKTRFVYFMKYLWWDNSSRRYNEVHIYKDT